MKKFTIRNTIASFLSVIFLVILLAGSAQATVDVGIATVKMVGYAPGYGGVGSSGVKVSLQNDTVATYSEWAPATTRMFYLSDTLGNKGLATILTAFATGNPVYVRIAGDAVAGSLISIIYINAQE